MTGGNGNLLTARDVADWLNVTPKTIRGWSRDGKLPAFELPDGDLRYDPDAVQEWLAAHRKKGGK